MDAQSTRKVANDEKFKTVLDFIRVATSDGEIQIVVAPHWIAGIKGRLKSAGYQLGGFTGASGNYHGAWVVIRW